MTRRREQIRQEQARARADADSVSALNAFWAAEASNVKAKAKAESDAANRGQNELVRHLLKPGALDAMAEARTRFNVPAIAAGDLLPTEICWAPAGTFDFGEGRLEVFDQLGATALRVSLAARHATGERVRIDFEHANSEPAGHVTGFRWDPSVGILAAVDWTKAGETALRDGLFCSFSPTYMRARSTGQVTGLVDGREAGSLTNSPAFGERMPPVLSARGRAAAADVVRETILASGHSPEAADAIGRAVRAGADGAAVSLLLQTISAMRGRW